MTKGSVAIRRLTIGSVAVGALAIIAGNSIIAMGVSFDTQSIGYAIRYVGLGICTMTAILFLLVRFDAHLRQRAQSPNPNPLPAELMNVTGPSQTLVTSIRVFCVLLYMLASYILFFASRDFIAATLGQFRLGGMPRAYVFFMLFFGLVLLAVGYLMWFMTKVIVRMSEQLDEVSFKVAKLQQRMQQSSAADRVDSSL